MEKDSKDRNRLTKPIGPVMVEWDFDLDDQWYETTSIGSGEWECKPGEKVSFE